MNWLQVATLSGKSWTLSGYLPDLAHILFNISLCGLKLFAGSSNFLCVSFSIIVRLGIQFPFTSVTRIARGSRSPETWCCSSRFQSPGGWWCSSRRYGELFRVLLTQFFTLGSASSLIFSWKYCVTVHVGILIANFSRNQSWAMNWLFALADVAKNSRARLLVRENKRFITAEETDKLLWVNVVRAMMFTNSVSCVHL